MRGKTSDITMVQCLGITALVRLHCLPQQPWRRDGEHAHQARLLHRRAGRGEQPHHLPGRSATTRSTTLGRPSQRHPPASSGWAPASPVRPPPSSGSRSAPETGPTASRTRPRRVPRSRVGTATTRSQAAPVTTSFGELKGVDTHAGGAGDDSIDARGDRGDVVSCGDGNDTVMADAADSIALDCETVDRGIVPPRRLPGPASAGPFGRGLSRPGRRRARWRPAPAPATWSARSETTV